MKKIKRDYINKKVFGLPKPLRDGKCTSPLKPEGTEYIYPVMINNQLRFKVQLHRGGKSKIKYFKDFKTAVLFRDMLRLNRYL
jgi:hypothetical protein